MAQKAVGGGSSAVAASAHAACARFRATDPLITGRARRKLAVDIGFADEHGGIPDARWMRAMTFERLVRDERFASEVATTAVGRLGLDRPTSVVIVNGHRQTVRTADLLRAAHDRAISEGAATMLYEVAVPFAGFEDSDSTPVLPDFAVVAPTLDGDSSWLIMGDAKDYERVRSRIDDQRLLKGFLQVALGAESAAAWSQLPEGMAVHDHGILAVPRNAFLQPEALVELLDDHRAEVRMRVAERRRESASATYDDATPIGEFVEHLEATYDPQSCTTCTLFSFCRNELQQSKDPADLLVELGVAADVRPHVVGLVDGTGEIGVVAESTLAMITATVEGVAAWTGQRRIDQTGLPGTVNVVLAKSDSAALGVYGIAVQRVTEAGAGEWKSTVFDDPQSAETRRAIMKLLGKELEAAMKDRRRVDPDAPSPVHLVVPDTATADLLASAADNLAGIELSRLRWEQDRIAGRPQLTFNGEPATVPKRLPEAARTAVSFLLEEDRARALAVRSVTIDLRRVLARHVIAGGPATNSQRLDYLVRWAQATPGSPIDHRALAAEIEASVHTPGARLVNDTSNAIHGSYAPRRRGGDRPSDAARYERLILEELDYKSGVLSDALAVLDTVPDSTLREVYRAIEGDAQAVWRRRLSLHASDLVRFGRTYRHWRNSLVPTIESDGLCDKQIQALANPKAALDAARDAGTRQLATAHVVGVHPLLLAIDSRRITAGSRIVLLHVDGEACVEGSDIEVKAQATAFKFTGLSIGPLSEVANAPGVVLWTPDVDPGLGVEQDLVVADVTWFSDLKSNKQLNLARPHVDDQSAPKTTCTEHSYEDDPAGHQYCCKPHEIGEAEWSDTLAVRRANGELNPDVWPPVVDGDAFEVSAAGASHGDPGSEPVEAVPDGVTMDDLDVA